MTSYKIPPFDFRQAVAGQFDGRPTLRQVASAQLLRVLLSNLPWLAYAKPALTNADPLMLDSPDPSTTYWTTAPFVDRVLEALLDPQALSLEPLADGRHYNLGLTGIHRFSGSSSEFDTRQLPDLSAALNQLVEDLPRHFCEAQLEFWRGKGSAGVSRDEWLQLLLKLALLRSLPWQGLGPQEQACIRGLLHGGDEQPAVYFVQTRLTSASMQYDQLQCQMLIAAEWDERQVILWCAPSGIVRSFESLHAFGLALRDELAQRYAFERMSWQRYPATGNVFAQQVSLLLDTVLARVELARYADIQDVPALEQRFDQLGDPSSWFVGYPDETPAVQPPPGLMASAQDSFACSAALLQLALYQLDSGGVSALDGVQSLTDYARQRLTRQIREDHGADSSPDDLVFDLYLARGIPGGAGTGTGGGEPLAFVGSKTLTEFAIGNLASLKGAAIERIYLRGGGEAPAWLDADAARALVTKVDIGSHYPAYVAAQLDDPAKRADRVTRLGREWRAALLAAALTAKMDGKIKEPGLQCVVDYCAGHVDPDAPRMILFPLAFRRSAASRVTDPVRCMYILFCAEPSLVLLYRPLFAKDTLREYASLSALLEHVRESEILQESILDWMQPSVRPVYDHGGFREPHISVIGIDPYALPERPEPARLAIEFWRSNIDEKLYTANRDLLLTLADEQSVSNAESRWQTLCEGAWLLFDVVTLALRGPVASVAWLVQLLNALQQDIEALERGNEFDRSAATVDLILNLGMVLLHARQPAKAFPSYALPGAAEVEGPEAQRGAFAEIAIAPIEETPAPGQALPSRWLDFSWRGQSGFNWLPREQREALRAMCAPVSLAGVQPLNQGTATGLYLIDGDHYVALASDTYRVERLPEGVRVVDGGGAAGPWLRFVDGVWRVDTALGLRGGMGRERTQKWLRDRFRDMHQKIEGLDSRAREARKQAGPFAKAVDELREKLLKLRELRATASERLAALPAEDEAGKSQLRTTLALYDKRKITFEQDHFTQMNRMLKELEAAVGADIEILALHATMREDKFAREREKGGWDGVLAEHDKVVRNSAINDAEITFTELWSLANYPELVEMQNALDGRPVREFADLYEKLRVKQQVVIDVQDRMLVGSEQLDQLLTETPEDFEVKDWGGNAKGTVADIIAKRSVSTVQLRFHQVVNLAELALHLESDRPDVIAGYRAALVSSSLRNAAEAHGELAFSNLPAQDRIVILHEAWDEYSAALVNSDRVRREGGALIEPAMIERYREHISKLKLDVNVRLGIAYDEQDHPLLPAGRRPYPASRVPQRLVRNGQGQLMIGNLIEGQSLLEVREKISDKVLATFEQVDGEWREVQQPSLSDEAPLADLASWVQSLLNKSNAHRASAKAYVEIDISGSLVARIYDLQLNKLTEAVSVVRDAGGDDALIKTLEQEVNALRAEKEVQLTTLYTHTSRPTAEALRFLYDLKAIKVVYLKRHVMADGSAFDEYLVQLLSNNRKLWAVHFHLRSQAAYARDFTSGHLKVWAQRYLSSQVARDTGQQLYRGKLTLQQATGIIPFDRPAAQ